MTRLTKSIFFLGVFFFCKSLIAEEFSFNIPPKPLEESLTTFTIITQYQLIYTNPIIAKTLGNSLIGRFTAEEALKKLLLDKEIKYQLSENNTFILTVVTKKKQETSAIQAIPIENNTKAIEEILVTARHRYENIQEVPISVSVINENRLKLFDYKKLSGLTGAIPNIEFHEGVQANNGIFFIRGIGENDTILSDEQGVALYIDDIYYPRAQGAMLELFNAERVEVLRGPQGTLYGRNSIGGAIKYITKEFSEEKSGEISIRLGSHQRRDIKGQLDIPIIDNKLLSRFSYAKLTRDGFQDFTVLSNEGWDENTEIYNMGLHWKTHDNIDLKLNLTNIDINSRTKAPKALPGTNNMSGTVALSLDGPDLPRDLINTNVDVIENNYAEIEILQRQSISASAIWHIDDKRTLTYIGSDTSLDNTREFDLDAGPDFLHGLNELFSFNSTSHELKYQYHSNRLNLVTGLFYFSEDGLNDIILRTGFVVTPDTSFLEGAEGRFVATDLTISERRDQELVSKALYSHFEYALTERTNVSAGIRWTQDVKNFFIDRRENRFGGNNNGSSGAASLRLAERIVTSPPLDFDEHTFEAITPHLGINTKPLDNVFIYYGYTRGFKAGGINGRAESLNLELDVGVVYEPELLDNHEIGFKSNWYNNRLFVNGSIFYMDYSDIQLNVFLANPEANQGFLTGIDNVGTQSSSGFELEIQAKPDKNLYTAISIGYLDTEFDRLIDGNINIANQLSPQFSPRWTIGLRGQYTDLSDTGKWDYTLHATYRSEQYTDPGTSGSQIPSSLSPSVIYLNAGIHFSPHGSPWKLSLQGKNLLNERRVVHSIDLTFLGLSNLAWYNQPHTWSLETVYSF